MAIGERMQSDFFKLTGVPPRMQALLDAMHAGDPDRWLPRRLILQSAYFSSFPQMQKDLGTLRVATATYYPPPPADTIPDDPTCGTEVIC